MNEKISKWLADPNRKYQEGVQLYEQFGRNKLLLRTFTLKQNDYNREKLQYELQKVSGLAPPAARRPVTPVTKKPAPPVKEKESGKDEPFPIGKDYPDELVDLIVELRKLHNTRGQLSNSLRSFEKGDKEGRKKVLEQIEKLVLRMNEIRVIRNYFEQYKKMPEAKNTIVPELPQNPLQLLQVLQNKKSNRSKWKRKRDKAKPSSKERAAAENKFNELNKEIDEIESIINIRKQEADKT